MLTSFSYPVIFQTMNPSKRIEMRSNVVLVCIFYSFVQFLVLLLSLSPHHDEPFYTEHTVSHFSLHFHLCSFFLVNIIGQFPSNTATNTPSIGIDFIRVLLLYCRLIEWFVVIQLLPYIVQIWSIQMCFKRFFLLLSVGFVLWAGDFFSYFSPKWIEYKSFFLKFHSIRLLK